MSPEKYITCPNCGYQNRATLKRCAICFSRLHGELYIFRGFEQPEIRKGKTLSRWLLFFIAILILMILLNFRIIRLW